MVGLFMNISQNFQKNFPKTYFPKLSEKPSPRVIVHTWKLTKKESSPKIIFLTDIQNNVAGITS